VYITLTCLIIVLNVLPRVGKKEKPVFAEKTEKTVFVDFNEAQERSKKIEGALKKKPSLYLFYMSANLLIIFIFLAGLALDGYFLSGVFRKKGFFFSAPGAESGANPPPWKISDVFKIIILAFSFSYVFFIAIFLNMAQSATGVKFGFFKNENFRMIFDTIVLDFFFLVVIAEFLRTGYKSSIQSLGLGTKKLKRNIFYGIAGYVGIIPVILIMGILIYVLLNLLKIKPPPQPIVGLFLMEKNVALVFVSGVIASVFGPVIEEIFFRGVMYNAVKRKLGVFRAVLITSALFSFLHTHAMTYFLVGFIPIMILGIVLAYLYEKTGSLVPSITLHVLNNVGSVFMVFLFKYFNSLV
jgi:uncharacterized protein